MNSLPFKLLYLLGLSTMAWGQSIRFTDVTREAGLIEPLAGIMGHGGAWGDFDGDGRIDLFVGGFCDRPNAEYKPADGPVAARLLRNLGNGRFERVAQPGIEFYGRTSGAVFADLDNNGTLELYVANNTKGSTRQPPGPQHDAQLRFSNLFRNDAGKLIDISDACGACPRTLRTARNIGVFDYDQDGRLDLFVVEDKFTKQPRSVLFRNLSDLRFEDVNAQVGLPDDIFGLGLAVADLNDDGRPDFFVGHSNRLFLSVPGHRYREAVELRDVFAWKQRDGEDWPCGAAFGDLNRDGRLDLLLGIHHHRARNRVYLNDGLVEGVPRFRDVTAEVGLPPELTNKSPHCEIQDFDNDGWPDLYFSTAWKDDGQITPLVFRNLGVKDGLPRFASPRSFQPDEKLVYFPAGPSGDYDGDGRVDLFLINWFADNHCRLLRNEGPAKNWLDVQVVGRRMNRMGIGAVVRVYSAGKLGEPKALLGVQEVTTGYGYASGQPAVCHFGLGDATEVDVRITLPDRTTIDQRRQPVNVRWIATEKAS